MENPPKIRCAWAVKEPNLSYHDREWGVPIHNDRMLFEFLILEGAQAGLSWETILRKRANYRKAFHGFDPKAVALYDARDTERLLGDEGIVRNRLKVASAIQNAKAFLDVQREFETFDKYIWSFVEGTQRVNRWKSFRDVPCLSAESDAMSRDLIRRGFKFVGIKICYSFMQAVGMVNDHTTTCFRYNEICALQEQENQSTKRTARAASRDAAS